MVPAIVSPIATLVPLCNAWLRALESVESPPLTRKEPSIEAIIPTSAIAIGNISCPITPDEVASAASSPPVTAKAVRATGAIIDPA